MKKLLSITSIIILLSGTFFFSGCAKGEDDPWLTLHSRDARMTQSWKLVSFNGTRVVTTDTSETNIEYTFDGTNLYTTINGVTSSVNYVFTMEIKDGGEVFSSEVQSDVNTLTPIIQSTKTSFWYWGDDEKTKTAVYLDLTGLFSDVLVYDIPRLAWNDMTISIAYSDNYTTGGGAAESLNVLYDLNFEVIIP